MNDDNDFFSESEFKLNESDIEVSMLEIEYFCVILVLFNLRIFFMDKFRNKIFL